MNSDRSKHSNGNSGNGRKRRKPVPPEKRCKYIASDGSQCRAARQQDADLCIFHDREFQRRINRAKAEEFVLQQRATPFSAQGIQDLLQRTVDAVRANEIAPAVANSIGYLSQLMTANLDKVQREFQAAESEADKQYESLRKRLCRKLDAISSSIRAAGGEQAEQAEGAEEALDEAAEEYAAALKKDVLE